MVLPLRVLGSLSPIACFAVLLKGELEGRYEKCQR
jgi:hypothetical protein